MRRLTISLLKAVPSDQTELLCLAESVDNDGMDETTVELTEQLGFVLDLGRWKRLFAAERGDHGLVLAPCFRKHLDTKVVEHLLEEGDLRTKTRVVVDQVTEVGVAPELEVADGGVGCEEAEEEGSTVGPRLGGGATGAGGSDLVRHKGCAREALLQRREHGPIRCGPALWIALAGPPDDVGGGEPLELDMVVYLGELVLHGVWCKDGDAEAMLVKAKRGRECTKKNKREANPREGKRASRLLSEKRKIDSAGPIRIARKCRCRERSPSVDLHSVRSSSQEEVAESPKVGGKRGEIDPGSAAATPSLHPTTPTSRHRISTLSMLSGHVLVRSAGRTLQRSARNLRPAARGVATEPRLVPRARLHGRAPLLALRRRAISIGAAVYTLRPSPIQCEPRKAWSDRMKPKESKGDAALHDDAHARHAPAAAHDEHVEPAEETPVAIEVAVEESERSRRVSSPHTTPETGEINWDCPCLGGMAHGPCGEQFKAAFSCFDCFREHPDVYKDEIEDDEAANAQFDKDEAEAAHESAQADAKSDDKVSESKEAQKAGQGGQVIGIRAMTAPF
ncbi:hypothetical protein L1887_50708 [Cichorium endivia]|nr:hypothetical protein L1887_50708 [Cichorium endivia]